MPQEMPPSTEPTPPIPGAEQRTAWASTGYVPYNPDVTQPNSNQTLKPISPNNGFIPGPGSYPTVIQPTLNPIVPNNGFMPGPGSYPTVFQPTLKPLTVLSGNIVYGSNVGQLVAANAENIFMQTGKAADWVVNGVEKAINISGNQSESLSDMAAKGNNVSPQEKSQLEAAGYKYQAGKTEITGYQKMYDVVGIDASGKSIYGWINEPLYNSTPGAWIAPPGLVQTALDTGYNLGMSVIDTSFNAGKSFGENVLKPALQETGLYDPTKAALYDLYNLSPIKFVSEPSIDTKIDVSGATLAEAQAEGIPVTYANGVFTINASGADYDRFSKRLNEIQEYQFNLKKTDLENLYMNGMQKRDNSIFGTGLTWDEGINQGLLKILPKKLTLGKEITDYGNSNQFGSGLVKGISEASVDWYNNKVAVAPVNAITEIGGNIAAGLVMGEAITGGALLLRTGAEVGSSILGAGSEAAGEGITSSILGVGSKALSLGSVVEETSIAGRTLNAVVNVSGKAAAGVDTAADVLSVGAKGLSIGSRYLEPAINTIATSQVVSDVASSKSYKEGVEKVAGLVVGGIGYKVGSKGALEAYDAVRTRGMSEIPIAEIVDAKVLSGENNFPLIEKGSTPKDVINAFKTSEGVSKGYHATPIEFKAETEAPNPAKVPRPSDMPGIYVSPEESGPSVHFTRIGGDSGNPYSNFVKGMKETSLGVQKTAKGLAQVGTEYFNENTDKSVVDAGMKTAKSGMEKVKSGIGQMTTSIVGGSTPMKPAILHIELARDVERLPGNAKYDYGEAEKVYRENAGSGRTFLTPVLERSLRGGGSPEAEAVITPETKLSKTGSEGYINFNGRRIPIFDYKTTADEVSETPKNLFSSESLKGESNEVKDYMEIEAGKLKNSYSYEPINNKGILSGIGYAPSAQRESSNNFHVSKIGFNIAESAIPSVKSPGDLRSSMESHSGFVSDGLKGVISGIESASSSSKYSQTLSGSRSASSSAVPGISRMLSLIPEQHIFPGSSSIDTNSMSRSASRLDEFVRSSSIDTNSANRGTSKPSDIVSGMTPSNPRPEPPSRITPDRIISGMTPSNPTPKRDGGGSYSGFSGFMSRPIPTVIRRTDIISSNSGSDRTSSHVSIIGSDFIPHYKPGGKKPDNDNQKKIIEKSSISGVKKHGILRNKFGDIDAFAKKALKGDQIKLKKIKL